MLKNILLLLFILNFSFFSTKAQNNNFISTWKIPNGTFELPLKNYSNITIDWGDATSTTHKNGIFPTHTYTASNNYQITISINDIAKNIGKMHINGKHPSKNMLLEVSNWGEGKWSSFSNAFYGAKNLTISATDAPDLSATTNMSQAFKDCLSLIGTNFNNWEVRTITNMAQLFAISKTQETVFNGAISNWNTANVTNMSGMFQNSIAFNSDISAWNTAKVTDMSKMFYGASSFNQNINTNGKHWNTAEVTTMKEMFQEASLFNGDITRWNTAKVTTLQAMFKEATSFNQNITTNGAIWNTAKVTNTKLLFYNAEAFNGDILNWNTSKVKDMHLMFYGAKSFKEKQRLIPSNWDMETFKSYRFKNPKNQNKKGVVLFIKKFYGYILVFLLLIIGGVLYVFRKRKIAKNTQHNPFIFNDLILKDIWSLQPLSNGLSENEAKISKLYHKEEIIKVFQLFEQKIFRDNVFEEKRINSKEFSKLVGIPLTHCFYLFKYHVSSASFTKFKNHARIEVALKLIENGYLIKGTFESLSVQVGFESYSTFYNSFKKHTSLTPSEYIRLNKTVLE